jgi:hypothetical protein
LCIREWTALEQSPHQPPNENLPVPAAAAFALLLSLFVSGALLQAATSEQDFDVPDSNNLGDGSVMIGNATVTGNVFQLTANTGGNNSAFLIPALVDSSQPRRQCGR